MFQNDDFIQRSKLAKKWQITPATLDRWSRTDPSFPKTIRINRRVVGFKLSEAEKWRESKFKAA